MIANQNCKSFVEMIFLFLFQPSNAQIYITTLSRYVMFTPTCFDISVSFSRNLKNVCLSRLHELLKLWLLKLQFNEIIRLKYIKILFGGR
jgi:hypothetical protein